MRGRPIRLAAAAAVLFGPPAPLVPPCRAVQTLQWAETAARLQRGEASGIAVTSRGRLFLAPRLERLGGQQEARREAHVWAVAAGTSGEVYLGTGPEGRILKVSPSGSQRVLYTVEEPMVTALALLPDGDLLAGTAPEGRVYRIEPDGSGRVWSETGERYVWSLALAPDGSVFAGTGEQGVVLRIDGSGEASPFFDSDEPHIVSLLVGTGNALVAGGAGRGLVYQVDEEGHPFVLHDDDLPEVRALARQRDGSLIVALLGPPPPEARPPEVRIQLPDGVRPAPVTESVGDLEEEPAGPTVAGVIEGLPLQIERPGPRLRGRLLRITAGGEVTEIWRSEDEAPYCLGLDEADRPIFGTGEPGRLWRADGEREISLLASVAEAQVSALARAGRGLIAATSNPSSAYRLEGEAAEGGVFLSPPFDAGGPARWGTMRWEMEARAARVELYTRTGNSSEPDATWSAWSPALTDPAGSAIVNPDGRFLQWRVRLAGADSARARVSGVTVSYAPYNRPAEIRDFRLHPGAEGFAHRGSFRWSAWDPDGDPLEVRVEYSPAGSTEWKVALRQTVDGGGEGGAWKAGEGTWDAGGVPEGTYLVRAVCSDQPGNHPGEGREAEAGPALRVTVDRTAPEITLRADGGAKLRVEVADERSAIARLEVLSGERVLFQARPEDGVCDSRRERFDLALPPGAEPPLKLRVTDGAGNSAERSLP